MKAIRVIIITVLSTLLLAGCAGNRINYNSASTLLEIGMNKAQVQAHLGAPKRAEVNEERERWVYWSPTMYGFNSVDNEALAADRLVITFREGLVSKWGNQTMHDDAMEMSTKIMEKAYSQPVKVEIEQK